MKDDRQTGGLAQWKRKFDQSQRS